MTINDIAGLAGVGVRTIIRDIEAYNDKNGTDFSTSTKIENDIVDDKILKFLSIKRSFDLPSAPTLSEEDFEDTWPLASEPLAHSFIATRRKSFDTPICPQTDEKCPGGQENGTERKNSKGLQVALASDLLVVVVLLIALMADVFSFYVLAEDGFSNHKQLSSLAPLVFSVLGFSCGIGAIVTYARIQNKVLSEIWKYLFAICQFVVFEFALHEMSVDFELWSGQTVMALMVNLSFVGVLRSVKN